MYFPPKSSIESANEMQSLLAVLVQQRFKVAFAYTARAGEPARYAGPIDRLQQDREVYDSIARSCLLLNLVDTR